MSARTLIRGGCVLTLDPKAGNFIEADVLIEGDLVVEVGRDVRARDADVVDAAGTTVMPGFVDTHRHTSESLFRNFGDNLSVDPTALGAHYQPDDVYAATLIGLLGALEAGITTVADWAELRPAPDYVDAALQAHRDSGIRSVLACADPTWAEPGQDWRSALRQLVARPDDARGSLLKVVAGPRQAVAGDVESMAGDWSLARELGLGIHTHAGLGPTERGLVAELAGRGLLGEDVVVTHCANLSDADLEAIVAEGAGVCLAPSSDMAAGLGAPPIQRLIDADIRPGLGIGSELAAPGDMFAPMRAVISVQHAIRFDLKLAGKAGLPRMLSTRDVIRYATVDGARVAGLDHVTGSLRPGMQADIVVLRTDRPNIFPINDPIGAVVWGMDTSNVDWVFVAGRPLMRNGVLGADLERVRRLATAAQRRVASASGLLAESTSGASE